MAGEKGQVEGKRPTIDDVAARSGVARTTVSRVLNNGPNVRPAVRERVMAAVRELGYQVNVQARFLAGGSSGLIAMIHASAFDVEPNSYYHSGLELGAMRACSALGLSLHTRAVDPHEPGYADIILQMVERLRCEGVILPPPFSDMHEVVEPLLAAKIPLVCIAAGEDIQQLTAVVGIDDAAAGKTMARHLIALGHRRFAYIDGPADHIAAGHRLVGFRAAMAEAGLDAEAMPVARGNFTFRSGSELAASLLRDHPEMTALACANDDMAVGASLTAHRLGLNVPSQLAITGFDDTPVSEIIWPPLTTIHQPIRAIGQKAVERIHVALSAGQSATAAGLERIDFALIERESTAPAPIS